MRSEEKVNLVNDTFPQVSEVVKREDYLEADRRQQYLYPIVMRYLKRKIAGWNVSDFFKMAGAKRIVLYAVTEFTELFCDDLKQQGSGAEILYVCDKKYGKYSRGYKGYRVVGIDEMLQAYQIGMIDHIVICSIFHENEIFAELLERGVQLEHLISINTVIFEPI